MPLLQGLSVFQRLGMWYRKKKSVYYPTVYTVSFGGLTIGGVGKTPSVIERAQQETASKKKVCVVSRGYGGKRDQRIVKGNRDGSNILISYYNTDGELDEEIICSYPEACRVLGDELVLVLVKVPEVTVVKHPNRILAVRWTEKYGYETVLLDDAYQYVMLGRNENILLLSAINPWGNGYVLPAGILREPLREMIRATEIWITHCDQVSNNVVKDISNTIKGIVPNIPIRLTYHRPLYFTNAEFTQFVPMEDFKGKKVDVFCAIANPNSFLNTLERLGIVIGNLFLERDHAFFPIDIIKRDRIILTTEKNILSLGRCDAEVYALCVEISDYYV